MRHASSVIIDNIFLRTINRYEEIRKMYGKREFEYACTMRNFLFLDQVFVFVCYIKTLVVPKTTSPTKTIFLTDLQRIHEAEYQKAHYSPTPPLFCAHVLKVNIIFRLH